MENWLFCKTLVVCWLVWFCKCANVGRLKLFFKMCGGKNFKPVRWAVVPKKGPLLSLNVVLSFR